VAAALVAAALVAARTLPGNFRVPTSSTRAKSGPVRNQQNQLSSTCGFSESSFLKQFCALPTESTVAYKIAFPSTRQKIFSLPYQGELGDYTT
jgi:hypothetical protein